MILKALVLCADDKILRVLRRALGDLEIQFENCANAEAALRQLTRDRFEAIIVDCAGPGSAEVLRSARLAPCNKRAVAVAILDPEAGMRSAFDVGAHFVLYKPISSERARSSFRAARALMKRERRRNSRLSVQIPVSIVDPESGTVVKVSTTDVGEGGMAVKMARRAKPGGRCQLSFTLPGSSDGLEISAEFAWEGSGSQAGLRFVDLAPNVAHQLREWLTRNAADGEQDDPPVRCQLTDLSLAGCYLEVVSPFPRFTRVTLSMRAGDAELRVEGVVRVMHPEKGMGLEFTQSTAEHRALLEQFLSVLTENRNLLPELLVEPEGLETEAQSSAAGGESTGPKDPLLDLFRIGAALPADSFLEKLRQQRGITARVGASA
jgi:CheY-like chemotaxis protein